MPPPVPHVRHPGHRRILSMTSKGLAGPKSHASISAALDRSGAAAAPGAARRIKVTAGG